MAYTTIDDPSVHFQTTIYTGDGASSKAIVNDGNSDLQPDWLWTKQRNAAQNNLLFDSSRGVTKYLKSGEYEAEATNAAFISSFNSDGFTLGNSTVVNDNNDTYVAWQWKANSGTTASNTDGTITSTVQANLTAGFNILTYTGTGSNATVGHGLGGTPDFITTKSRNVGARGWTTWTNALAGTQALDLNTADAAYTSATSWNSTVPSSSVISLGTRLATNENNTTYVAYCFKNIQGYSKIGKYIGNGNANGTFVYTGFKVSFVICKSSSLSTNWVMKDSTRSPENPVDERLFPNLTRAETQGADLDFLCNGFKVRSSSNEVNTSGATYIYMAFAENPFVSSKGVPTTAR